MIFKKTALSSATAIILSCVSTTQVQSADSADLVVQPDSNAATRSAQLNPIKAAMRARPHANNQSNPDTTNAYAEIGNSEFSAGFMSKRGAVNADQQSQRRAFGSFGIPYTTTRVQEGSRSAIANNANRLSTTYPYRAVGKLTFVTDTGRASFCTASIIRRGVIVTAAHCIQQFGGGRTLFTNFSFQPGHYGGRGATAAQIAPYGTWRPGAILRPGSWSAGTDVGSGAARENDIALMTIRMQNGRHIGSIVGYLPYGWNNYSFVSSPKTGNLRTAAITSLGYPGLMDAGRVMQRTDGPTYTTTVGSAPQLWQGSNFTGGASGGPWIVNFSGRRAALSGGAVRGTAPVMAVVGVTSWGARDPNSPKDNYASQFVQNSRYPNADYGGYGAGNIGSLLNTLCNAAAPGGGTYASQGYCD